MKIGEGNTPNVGRDSELITDGRRCQWSDLAGAKSLNQKGRAAGQPPCFPRFVCGLYRLHILCLPPFGALNYVKLHLLALLQTAEPARLNRREVYKNILATLAADETIAFGIVKPLYCSCFHGVARFLFVRYALCPSQNYIRQVTLSRELLKLQSQTLQDCTSDIRQFAKLFQPSRTNRPIINRLRPPLRRDWKLFPVRCIMKRCVFPVSQFCSCYLRLPSPILSTTFVPRWLREILPPIPNCKLIARNMESIPIHGGPFLDGARSPNVNELEQAEPQPSKPALVTQLLRKRSLDAEPHLPIALGAAFEVQARVLAAHGQNAQPAALLRRALVTYGNTSISPRLHKNLNCCGLTALPAPSLNTTEYLVPALFH